MVPVTAEASQTGDAIISIPTSGTEDGEEPASKNTEAAAKADASADSQATEDGEEAAEETALGVDLDSPPTTLRDITAARGQGFLVKDIEDLIVADIGDADKVEEVRKVFWSIRKSGLFNALTFLVLKRVALKKFFTDASVPDTWIDHIETALGVEFDSDSDSSSDDDGEEAAEEDDDILQQTYFTHKFPVALWTKGGGTHFTNGVYEQCKEVYGTEKYPSYQRRCGESKLDNHLFIVHDDGFWWLGHKEPGKADYYRAQTLDSAWEVITNPPYRSGRGERPAPHVKALDFLPSQSK